MADEVYDYSPGQTTKQIIPNSLKWLWNKTVYDNMKYYRTKKSQLIVRKSLLISYLINILTDKIKRLKTLEGKEKQMGLVESEIQPKTLEVYNRLGGYTSLEVIDKEIDYIKNGTGFIDARITIGRHNYTYPLPDKKPLIFPDGSIQYPSYYGRDERDRLGRNVFGPLIARIVNDAKSDVDAMTITPEHKDRRKTALVAYGDASSSLLTTFVGKDEEGSLYAMFNRLKSKLEEFKASMTTYDGLWEKLMNNRAQDVVYLHTYHKVRQVDKNYRKFDATTAGPNFLKNADEVDWGLDDRGMPLEVVPEGGHRFTDRFGMTHDLQEGDILMDAFIKYSTNPPGAITIRRVPPEFIERIDLLEAGNYIYAEWDNFRDDFRDGRYHPQSLTVTDYIMAASPSLQGEWKRKRKPNNIRGNYGIYKMEINGSSAPFNAPFRNRRKPSDLNPAFDLRILERNSIGKVKRIKIPWRYIGSKRYYAPNEVCANEQEDPCITTRGLSMFIIEEVCRKGKNMREISEELIAIGKTTSGFDYGPRNFGDQNFCMNPFAVDYQRVNEKRASNENRMA